MHKIILFVRAEEKLQRKKVKMNGSKKDAELPEKPDVSDLPLPELPNFYKKKHFFLYGDFSPTKQHELQRYITAYNGYFFTYFFFYCTVYKAAKLCHFFFMFSLY